MESSRKKWGGQCPEKDERAEPEVFGHLFGQRLLPCRWQRGIGDSGEGAPHRDEQPSAVGQPSRHEKRGKNEAPELCGEPSPREKQRTESGKKLHVAPSGQPKPKHQEGDQGA